MEIFMADGNGKLHELHRARMRKKFLKNGLECFEEHEILEMLLYMSIPRGDVNPTAHLLLNKFGTVEGVLSADTDDLMSVKGVGDVTATRLHFVGETYGFMTDRLFRTVPLNTKESIASFAVMRMGCAVAESAYAAFTDLDGKLIHTVTLYRSARFRTSNIAEKIITEAQRCCAYGIILMHNHKGEPLIPSPDDDAITQNLRKMAAEVGITSVEHVITSEEGFIFI